MGSLDMRKGADKFCKQCSSEAQRLVYHDKANRCLKVVSKINVGEVRGLQQAVAERTARIAASSAQSAAEGDDADGEVVELAEVQQQGEVIGGKASKKPRVVAASKVVFVRCFWILPSSSIPSGISAGRGGGWSRVSVARQ